MTGRRNPVGWNQDNALVDFYDAKGIVEELLAQLSTPVVVDEALQDSLIAHTKALLSGSETMDQAVEGVVGDLSLRFAEQG